jgi:hypothetical protein
MFRGTRKILHVDMTFSKKLPRVSNGFEILVWRVISSAHNLTVVQTVRSQLHTILNNICTVLTLSRIELGTPKSLNQGVLVIVLVYIFKKKGDEMRSWAGFEPRPFGTEAELVYHYAIDVLLHA